MKLGAGLVGFTISVSARLLPGAVLKNRQENVIILPLGSEEADPSSVTDWPVTAFASGPASAVGAALTPTVTVAVFDSAPWGVSLTLYVKRSVPKNPELGV